MSKVILTGVDDSATALRAAERAASLAAAFGAELHVMCAFAVKTSDTIESLRGRKEHAAMDHAYNALVDRSAKAAQHTASTVASGLRKKFPELTIISKTSQGAPGSALLREADNLDADVVVVGNRRLQGPTRILGSIARTVASEANCDVYIVHTHQR